MCPIHKIESKNIKSNYRPISLQPTLSKSFEKINFNSLYDLLVNFQSGFIKDDSCESQLLDITHCIHKHLDAKTIFLDMSQVFDEVWHHGWIFKLRLYGIQSNLLHLLQYFLHSRKQQVIINGVTSSRKPIKTGVPQGSVLSPQLFHIFINDLPENLICNPKLFADGVSPSAVMHDDNLSNESLKKDLK